MVPGAAGRDGGIFEGGENGSGGGLRGEKGEGGEWNRI